MIDKGYCQSLIDDLCQEYGIPKIEVSFDTSLFTTESAGGQFNFLIMKIVVDENEPELLEILFHEFRHYWQYIHYPEIFFWWTCCSGGLYKKYYHTAFCSIEEDARVFGTSHGTEDREDLLRAYDASFLSFLKDEPGSLRQILQALGVDKMW